MDWNPDDAKEQALAMDSLINSDSQNIHDNDNFDILTRNDTDHFQFFFGGATAIDFLTNNVNNVGSESATLQSNGLQASSDLPYCHPIVSTAPDSSNLDEVNFAESVFSQPNSESGLEAIVPLCAPSTSSATKKKRKWISVATKLSVEQCTNHSAICGHKYAEAVSRGGPSSKILQCKVHVDCTHLVRMMRAKNSLDQYCIDEYGSHGETSVHPVNGLSPALLAY